MNKTAAFFLAYNEEETLPGLLERVPDNVDAFLFDDGSTDRTPDIAREQDVTVIQHPINLGQGMTCLTALKYFVNTSYQYAISLDADGQHNPEEIPKFIETLEATDYDIVAGSRLLGSNYEEAPLFRKIGLKPLNRILDFLTNYQLSDYMCGFRGFRVEALRKVEPLFETMTETSYIASEMWIKFSHAGLTAVDIPINLKQRASGSSYKGHALAQYGFGVLRTILRSVLETYRDPDS
ncbi:MAG: glycosyltransferase family 2 protein [bacterium]